MNDSSFQIGELAAQTGVSLDTVRYYEKLGLIKPAHRTASGYRKFSEEIVGVIKFIKQAQELGFSLNEIKGLLGSGGADECRKVHDLLVVKLEEIEEQLKRVKQFKKVLQNRLRACETELNQKGQNAHCPAFFEIERGKSNE